MQDEHFIRDWSGSHDAFTAGVTRMLSKVSPSSGQPVPDRGTDLRYAHANRIFVAIVVGMLAGIIVASGAMTIESATPSASREAGQAGAYRVALQ